MCVPYVFLTLKKYINNSSRTITHFFVEYVPPATLAFLFLLFPLRVFFERVEFKVSHLPGPKCICHVHSHFSRESESAVYSRQLF